MSRQPAIAARRGRPGRRARLHAAEPQRRARPVLHPQHRRSSPTPRAATGLGEVPGGETIRTTIEDAGALLVGQPVARYRTPAARRRRGVRRPRRRRPRPADLRPAHHRPRRHRARVGAARPARPVPRRAGRRAARRRASSATACRCSATCSTSATPTAPTCPTCASTDAGGRLGAAAPRGGDDPRGRRRAWPRPRRTATASATSSSRAACCRRRGGRRPSPRCTSASPTPGSPSTPTAAGCSRTPSGCGRACDGVARVRRGPVRRRGRLLRPRGHGRVPPRHRAADRDQHDRHRLAPDGPRRAHQRRRHPAGRPALLDHGRLGPGRPAVPRLRADLGLALQQPLRHLAGDVHPRRRGRPGRDHRARHALDLAGRPGPDRASRCRSATARSRCPTPRASASSSTATALDAGARALPASTASAPATTRSPCSTSSTAGRSTPSAPAWSDDGALRCRSTPTSPSSSARSRGRAGVPSRR